MYLIVKNRDFCVFVWVLKKSPNFYVRALRHYYENCSPEDLHTSFDADYLF
jgi:hypothetical protein